MNISRFFIAVGVASSMALVACGGAGDPSEELAEEQSALGEIGCTTAGGTPYLEKHGKSTTPSSSCNTTQTLYSAHASYDNGPTCTDQYIFEIRDIQGRAFTPVPGLDFDLDAAWCDRYTVEAALYLRDAATQQWTTHTTKLVGAMNHAGACSLHYAAGYSSLPSVSGSEGYDVARLAVKGTLTLYIFVEGPTHYKLPVKVDIQYPPSPC